MPANTLQSFGGFPVILVICAAVALFLALRLRSVLGKRVGFERKPLPQPLSPVAPGPIIEGHATPLTPSGRIVPDPRSEIGQRLMQIVQRDPHFDPPLFLAEAEEHFRAIVTGFAAGDRATLEALLTPHVFETFAAAIAAREAAGQRLRTEIKSIDTVSIEDAQLVGAQAAIIVRFASTQITQTLDEAGTPTPGGPEMADLTDLWTFERVLRGPDPVWRLAAARNG